MKAAWRCVLTAAMACSFSAASQALQAVDANALAGQKIGILIEVGELESAAVLLQALDAQNQISPALAARRMGDLYYQLGQYGRAIDIYKSIPTDGARSAHDTGQIALAYVKLNDRSALKIHLESVPTPLTGRFLRRVQAYDALKIRVRLWPLTSSRLMPAAVPRRRWASWTWHGFFMRWVRSQMQ